VRGLVKAVAITFSTCFFSDFFSKKVQDCPLFLKKVRCPLRKIAGSNTPSYFQKENAALQI
jgi:hypothetical protein